MNNIIDKSRFSEEIKELLDIMKFYLEDNSQFILLIRTFLKHSISLDNLNNETNIRENASKIHSLEDISNTTIIDDLNNGVDIKKINIDDFIKSISRVIDNYFAIYSSDIYKTFSNLKKEVDDFMLDGAINNKLSKEYVEGILKDTDSSDGEFQLLVSELLGKINENSDDGFIQLATFVAFLEKHRVEFINTLTEIRNKYESLLLRPGNEIDTDNIEFISSSYVQDAEMSEDFIKNKLKVQLNVKSIEAKTFASFMKDFRDLTDKFNNFSKLNNNSYDELSTYLKEYIEQGLDYIGVLRYCEQYRIC